MRPCVSFHRHLCVICNCLPRLPNQLHFPVLAIEASRPHLSDCHLGVTGGWDAGCLWVQGEERKKGKCQGAGTVEQMM